MSSSKDKFSTEETVDAHDTAPPAYDDHPEFASEAGQPPTPEYITPAEASCTPAYSGTTAVAPYRPFPALMTAHYHIHLLGVRYFDLCAATRADKLYLVEVTLGWHTNGLLGRRTGILLHNGLQKSDRVVAAAGANTSSAGSRRGFAVNTTIKMPALPGRMASDTHGLVMETMRAGTVREGDNTVVMFRFGVEVGSEEKMRRETFEWRRVPKASVGGDFSAGGYKLLRLNMTDSPSEDTNEGESSASVTFVPGVTPPLPDTQGAEVVATLAWPGVPMNMRDAFTLRLVGSGESGVLGQRWSLMTVITALRLWEHHSIGNETKVAERMGEKIHS